jgi:hypothetical protein
VGYTFNEKGQIEEAAAGAHVSTSNAPEPIRSSRRAVAHRRYTEDGADPYNRIMTAPSTPGSARTLSEHNASFSFPSNFSGTAASSLSGAEAGSDGSVAGTEYSGDNVAYVGAGTQEGSAGTPVGEYGMLQARMVEVDGNVIKLKVRRVHEAAHEERVEVCNNELSPREITN